MVRRENSLNLHWNPTALPGSFDSAPMVLAVDNTFEALRSGLTGLNNYVSL